jgi:hypothetical protein
MIRNLLVAVCLFTSICVTGYSATFYADFATGNDANTSAQAQSQSTPWKFIPGMVGCASACAAYSVQTGDVFVLKGGVTWTFAGSDAILFTVPASGITIRGGQLLETPWGSGYPILNGGTSEAADRIGVYSLNKNTVVLDGLKIINVAYTDGSGRGIYYASSGNNMEVKNCFISDTGVNGLDYYPANGSISNFTFHHNTVQRVSRVYIVSGDAYKIDNIDIHNNTFLGPGDIESGVYHGDGILIGSNCTTKPSDCMTNVLIHHNKFSGDWLQGATAFIYMQTGDGPAYASPTNRWGGYHAKIYDNQFMVESDGFISPAYVVVYAGWKDVQIYNNSFGAYSSVNPVGNCISGAYLDTDADIDIRNNIFANCTNGVNVEGLDSTAGALYIQNNLYGTGMTRYIQDSHNDYRSVVALQGAGYENNLNATSLVNVDPKYVANPTATVGVGDFHLQSNSPAVASAEVLNSVFTTDFDEVSRGTVWDIGTFEYETEAPDTTNPSITIQSPTSSATYAASDASLSISGIASDNIGVSSVTWTCDNCIVTSGTATGTTGWSRALTLAEGSNTIIVTAHDAATNTATDQIVVTYTPIAPPDVLNPGSRGRMRR